MRVAHLAQQIAADPLQHIGVARPKGFALGQLKAGARALGQAHQMLLQGRRQLTRAQRQGGGLVRKGVDDVALRAGQAVVQGQKGAGGDTHNGFRGGRGHKAVGFRVPL